MEHLGPRWVLPPWSHVLAYRSSLVPSNSPIGGLNSIEIPCHNPTLRECEDETHTLEMGTWESSGTPKTSEFDCRGQNTSHWGVPYIIEKLSKCRCRKWAHGPFEHLQHTLWQKERPGVKLAV